MPERDLICSKRRTVILDLENNRISKDMYDPLFSPVTGTFVTTHEIQKFDGKLNKVFLPLEDNENLINRGDLNPEAWLGTQEKGSAVHFEPDDLPVFLAHGLIRIHAKDNLIGQWWAGPRSHSLRLPVDGAGLTVHGQAVFNERTCLILRTVKEQDAPAGTFEEYWVHPEWESAVLVVVYYVRGKVYQTITIDYQLTPHGPLPKRWVRTYSNEYIPGAPASLEKSCTIEVQECVVNADLSPEDFEIATKPGMIVMSPDKVPLRVAGDGRTLVPLGEEEGVIKRWSTPLGVIIGLLVLVFGLRWFIRFQKVRTERPSPKRR